MEDSKHDKGNSLRLVGHWEQSGTQNLHGRGIELHVQETSRSLRTSSATSAIHLKVCVPRCRQADEHTEGFLGSHTRMVCVCSAKWIAFAGEKQ